MRRTQNQIRANVSVPVVLFSLYPIVQDLTCKHLFPYVLEKLLFVFLPFLSSADMLHSVNSVEKVNLPDNEEIS